MTAISFYHLGIGGHLNLKTNTLIFAQWQKSLNDVTVIEQHMPEWHSVQ